MLRLRLLIILAFIVLAALSYYAWWRMDHHVSRLMQTVEEGSRPDSSLIRIKELWIEVSATSAALQNYRLTQDETVLERFIVRKDSLSSVLDTLSIQHRNVYGDLPGQLHTLLDEKAALYQQLLDINYNRRVTSALDKIGSLDFDNDTILTDPEFGNFFQRLFSSRYSREALRARADSILLARQQRMEEYRRNLKKIRTEEATILASQAARELELLEHDRELTRKAGAILLQLDGKERQRQLNNRKRWQVDSQRSASAIRNIMIIGLISFAFLFIVVILETEAANRRRKELAAARDRADRLAAAREEFMATMSHEIRTPLTVVTGFAEQLAQSAPGTEAQRAAKAILGSSKHLLSVVNDVLDYTRIEAGKFRFLNESFNVNDVFNEVCEALRWKAEEKNIELKLYAHPVTPATLFGDPVRLRQVLYNLTGNAIRFTDRGSVSITVTLTDEKDHAVLLFNVTDTGPGIPADHLKSIFHEFEQRGDDHEKTHGGTGLGLAITKRIIDQLGGTIAVESTPGLGSAFRVRIPYPWGEEPVVEESFTDESVPKLLTGKTILVVEDDPLISELISQYIHQAGGKSETASLGKVATELLEKQPFEAILLDKQLPDFSGEALALQIRKNTGKNPMPVILISANLVPADEALKERGIVDAVMLKPFASATLVETLHRLITSPKVEIAPPKVRSYDLNELKKATADNPEQLRKLINLFLTTSFASLNNLQFHLRSGNFEQLGKTAHRMIGSCRQIGLEHTADLLKDLEKECAGTADKQRKTMLVGQIHQQLTGAMDLLKEDLQKI